MWRDEINFSSFLTSALDEGEWSALCPSLFLALPWRHNLRYTLIGRLDGSFEENRDFLPFPGIELRVVEKLDVVEMWKPAKHLMLETGKHGLKLIRCFCLVKGMHRWNFAKWFVKIGERIAVSRNWNFIGLLSTHNYFSLITWMSRIVVCKWIIFDTPSLNKVQSAAYRTTECQKWNVCLC